LLWSLRFRDRNGGFYWHSEPDGANLYKAFHWPPSPVGDPYDETKLLEMARAAAFAIRGLPEPQIPVPAPPKLLPIADTAAISWQGSVGAKSYLVERSAKMDAEWTIVGFNIDEAFTQYRPQFADENVPAGKWFYRVRARNDAGISEPSNIVGPVDVKTASLVDELADFSKISSKSGNWTIANGGSRVTKEDIHRAAGSAGDTLIYKLPSTIDSFKVYCFFEKAVAAIKISASDDGVEFHEIAAQMENDFHGPGDYGYWKPVLFHAESIPGGTFLKLQLTGGTQISRVEISHLARPQ
jgi:hypothetical protein